MDHAPLPPHERAWRHPSELAAADRVALASEPPSASVRTVALVGGTTGVLLIGVGLLALTPVRDAAPAALSATTTVRAAAPVALTTPDRTDAPPSAPGGSVPSAPVPAIAVGDGDLAVTTYHALAPHLDEAGTGGSLDGLRVDVGSGPVEVAAIVDAGSDDGIVVVALGERAGAPTYPLALVPPAPEAIVTILTDPPVDVRFADVDDLIDELGVPDGTGVIDRDGALVGLCSRPTAVARPAPTVELIGVALDGVAVDRVEPDVAVTVADVVATTAPR